MAVSLSSKNWQLRQLVKLEQSQPAMIQRALGRLTEEDEALRWSIVVSAYLDEEISLARAASILGLHPLELREMFVNKGIPLHLGPQDAADAQAEIDAIRAWKRTTHKDG